MFKRFQGFVVGLLVCFILTGIVFASSTSEQISVFFDNIKIVIDGEEINPKDSNGQKVEPFIYNGTTYLPVRAVSEALGKEVSWDGVEKVVYLGAKPGTTKSWLEECKPYKYSNGKEYHHSNNEYFTMSGEKYTNGFVLNTSYWYDESEALYNLNGKYKKLSFKVGQIDGCEYANDATLNIYLDGIIAYTTTIKYDDVARTVSIPLDNALQMKIEVDAKPYSPSSAYGFSEGVFE